MRLLHLRRAAGDMERFHAAPFEGAPFIKASAWPEDIYWLSSNRIGSC
jgi:hypothetical protein